MNGHIKIHRKILNWEWWDDVNTFRLFMTILLLANWEDKKWRGKTIERGSLWTSISSLAKKSGLTVRETRTALNHLISTREVTCEATSRGMLVTVANYDVYQNKPRKATSKTTSTLANDRQTSDKLPTTTEEYKEYKEREEGSESPEENYIFFADID